MVSVDIGRLVLVDDGLQSLHVPLHLLFIFLVLLLIIHSGFLQFFVFLQKTMLRAD